MKTLRNEAKRGCGYRSQGGTYLMGEGVSAPCGVLPLQLTVCPCCSQGIKPARGWTWIEPGKLFADQIAALPHTCGMGHCSRCPMPTVSQLLSQSLAGGVDDDRAGLLWIGEAHYATPAEWLEEARVQGVSRKVPAVPTGFVLGETWIYVAHRKACLDKCTGQSSAVKFTDAQGMCMDIGCEDCGGSGQMQVPGVFHFFKPSRIDYILKANEVFPAQALEVALQYVDSISAGMADEDRAKYAVEAIEEAIEDNLHGLLGWEVSQAVQVQLQWKHTTLLEHSQTLTLEHCKKLKALAAKVAKGITLVNLIRTDGQDDVHTAKTRNSN